MAPPSVPRWPLVLLFTALACRSREIEFHAVSELAGAPTVGFALSMDLEGARPELASPPFAVSGEDFVPLDIEVEEDRRLVLLLVDDARLAALGVIRASGDPTEHALVFDHEVCTEGARLENGDHARLRLPADRVFATFELGAQGAPFAPVAPASIPPLRTMSLEIPLGPSACSDVGAERVHLFDPEAPILLPPGSTVEGESVYDGDRLSANYVVREFEPITEARLVASTPGALFDFQRGRPYLDEPRHRMRFEEVAGLPAISNPDAIGWIWSLVHHVPSASGGIDRVIALVVELPLADRPVSQSAVVVLELDADGFLSARTSTISPGGARALLVDEDGAVLVLIQPPEAPLGASGRADLLRAAGPMGPWTRRELPSVQTGNFLTQSGVPTMPHLAGFAGGQMMIGDLDSDPDSARVLQLEGDAARRGRVESITSVLGAQGSEYWAGDSKGGLYRGGIGGGTAERVRLRLAPEAHECGGRRDPCGWSEPTSFIYGLEPVSGGTHLVVSLFGCPHLSLFRPADSCAGVIPLPKPSTPEPDHIARRLARLGSRVFVSELDSTVYVIESP